jgi:chromosome segregation ATPase
MNPNSVEVLKMLISILGPIVAIWLFSRRSKIREETEFWNEINKLREKVATLEMNHAVSTKSTEMILEQLSEVKAQLNNMTKTINDMNLRLGSWDKMA